MLKQKVRTFVSATLAEKTRTPPRRFLWWCFCRWELTKGSLREGAGAVRRLRESALLLGQSKFQVTQAHSTAIAVPRLASARSRSGSDTTPWCHSLPSRRFANSRRKAFVRSSSADSGFGLLPDGAWTSTRYACPRCKRRESRK